jgi:EAL domain-containing protein (putative c-di-GMP-specific phosphodiesterase class I)
VDDLTFRTVFQPIIRLDDHVVAGYEALARFDDGTPPDIRLAGLASIADRVEIEARLVTAAVSGSCVPGSRGLVAAGSDAGDGGVHLAPGIWLSVNASIELVGTNPAFWSRFASAVPLVVELDAEALSALPDPMAVVSGLPDGIGLALSGVTARYRDLSLVRALAPRFVKLDAAWVHGVDADPARQALLAALVTVVRDVGAELIALGVETAVELQVVRSLGASLGQGYFLGRPSQYLR